MGNIFSRHHSVVRIYKAYAEKYMLNKHCV